MLSVHSKKEKGTFKMKVYILDPASAFTLIFLNENIYFTRLENRKSHRSTHQLSKTISCQLPTHPHNFSRKATAGRGDPSTTWTHADDRVHQACIWLNTHKSFISVFSKY